MAKYRKLPIEIEALQWENRGTRVDEMDEFIGKKLAVMGGCLVIPTLEGEMRANVGDWIIKGVQGEFYPCRPDIFEQTYELA